MQPAASDTPPASASTPPEWGSTRSHAIPAFEIIGFDSLLNLFDRHHFGCCDFNSNLSSIRRNLHSRWVIDSDSFTVNQLGHPYQGSMYHGFARASGLGYWEALGYTFAGSAMWEIAGETTLPSRNDQISTGIGGSFLGEALFRMANLWLEEEHGPPLLREIAAAAISPPVGFNRLAFGDRFRGLFPSHNPRYYTRLQIGLASATQNEPGTSQGVKRQEAIVDYTLEYGLPGQPGYTYRRPFDYFSFQASASSAVGFDTVLTHGMLLGTDYRLGKNYEGIWGVYGSYDYLAPQVFRMASTALSLGTTGEWLVAPKIALRGTALAGMGFATVSTINGEHDETANHYGIAPQTSLSLRLIFGERASLDLTGREYYVSRVSGGSRGGHDNVVRGDATFVWRVAGRHGVALKYQVARRDSTFPDLGDRSQTRGTIGIYYTLLGRDRFAGSD
ncbi:MAG TPA: DUF3943 domain-containing protein [Casimicrobiaceae bacterium]|nr:DUF3943 domain-containing protein [Casimicrobiaceae bacterium]